MRESLLIRKEQLEIIKISYDFPNNILALLHLRDGKYYVDLVTEQGELITENKTYRTKEYDEIDLFHYCSNKYILFKTTPENKLSTNSNRKSLLLFELDEIYSYSMGFITQEPSHLFISNFFFWGENEVLLSGYSFTLGHTDFVTFVNVKESSLFLVHPFSITSKLSKNGHYGYLDFISGVDHDKKLVSGISIDPDVSAASLYIFDFNNISNPKQKFLMNFENTWDFIATCFSKNETILYVLTEQNGILGYDYETMKLVKVFQFPNKEIYGLDKSGNSYLLDSKYIDFQILNNDVALVIDNYGKSFFVKNLKSGNIKYYVFDANTNVTYGNNLIFFILDGNLMKIELEIQ